MAFVKVEKLRTGGRGTLAPTVTMGAYLADGDRHKSKHVIFRLSRSLLTQLGWEFTDRTINFTVNEGTDDDKGYLQIVPSEYGRRSTVGTGEHAGLSISVAIEGFKHYVLNECPVSAAPVVYLIDDKALIIECPDWLRFNPQSVPEPEKKENITQLNREQRRAIGARVARNPKR